MKSMSGEHHFVSDLHMFSRRSLAPRHEAAIQRTAARSRTFVLGGDIFDFRWSILPSLERTIEAAIEWLGELTDRNPHCDFHFVMGNHDYNGSFMAALSKLAQRTSNLQWHPTHLRLGQSLFLHGDIADKPRLCHEKLLRRRQRFWDDEPAQGRLANSVYDWVIKARLHHLAKLVHRHKRVTTRLLHYVDRIGHGAESGLRHVYFGHTHYAMSDYERGGILFHNGGAPIHGLDFRIVPVEIQS
jgi:UDP-2,3-diacylglucosamine hydrolase